MRAIFEIHFETSSAVVSSKLLHSQLSWVEAVVQTHRFFFNSQFTKPCPQHCSSILKFEVT